MRIFIAQCLSVATLSLAFSLLTLSPLAVKSTSAADQPQTSTRAQISKRAATAFFEKRIRPLLVKHCYECHSEEAGEREGGLLLDRRVGWIEGGERGQAVIPGEPGSSLLITSLRWDDEDLQMPPEQPLSPNEIKLFEQWIRLGAPGPKVDIGESEFSESGGQAAIFEQAKEHWAFQPVNAATPPKASDPQWNRNAIDQFVHAKLAENKLKPSPSADARTLYRRLSYDLTGLPPTLADIRKFQAAAKKNREATIRDTVDRMIASPAFGEHIGRLWLDVARYADTDSFYRPDTRTPHYFPFAFTYRDYVIRSLNEDKPFDDFIREQLAADQIGFKRGDPEMAALGFLAVGPYANRDAAEALDDWIDLTTRGLMGISGACARCHDHKYEPVPTEDYYSLRGVFASIVRPSAIREENLPEIPGYEVSEADRADYEKKRATIEAKIEKAGGSKSKNNNRSVAQKIRETELAELLLFHPGAPAHAMVVADRKRPLEPVVFVRGDASNPGDQVPRRFLKLLDPDQTPFSEKASGRLEVAEQIVDPKNPLTARVFVNRVWGYLMGSHLVNTPSDFGLQGSSPTHPELLDWLAHDFVANGWSIKHLVSSIVLSQTYQQQTVHRAKAAEVDPTNRLLWRANRKHLSIEQLRDSILAVSKELDLTQFGRAAELWSGDYTRRRSIYGYINRFNLDPTLRAFDFPTPMQSQPARNESIVAPQALFTMNAPFVIDQAIALTQKEDFTSAKTDSDRAQVVFESILQRRAVELELTRVNRFLELQARFKTEKDRQRRATPWALVAQSLIMSNEFQYLD